MGVAPAKMLHEVAMPQPTNNPNLGLEEKNSLEEEGKSDISPPCLSSYLENE